VFYPQLVPQSQKNQLADSVRKLHHDDSPEDATWQQHMTLKILLVLLLRQEQTQLMFALVRAIANQYCIHSTLTQALRAQQP
jgi:hypothetical protein